MDMKIFVDDMRIYFTIFGFRAICNTCKMNSHVLIAVNKPSQPAPHGTKCDCNCHK